MTMHMFVGTSIFWQSMAVKSLVRQAEDAARRLTKGIDKARERARLEAALKSLERMVISQSSGPRKLSDAGAGAYLRRLKNIGKIRMPYCLDAGDSFFLILEPFTNTQIDVRFPIPQKRPAIAILRSSEQNDTGAASDAEPRLLRQLRSSRLIPEPVPIGLARHHEITEALRSCIRPVAGQQGWASRLAYNDGSVSGDIKLGSAVERERPKTKSSLSVGLMSCRHFEIDSKIDLYLMRNSEIERDGEATFRDQENLAFDRATALLDEHLNYFGLEIRLYHTGLEPAVIGIYRAVLESINKGRSLVVTPVPFRERELLPWW